MLLIINFLFNSVYKFNETTNKLEKSYPKFKHEAWFPCYSYNVYGSDLKRFTTEIPNATKKKFKISTKRQKSIIS
jgi:hypothetical protein